MNMNLTTKGKNNILRKYKKIQIISEKGDEERI